MDGLRSLDERSFGLILRKCLGLHNTVREHHARHKVCHVYTFIYSYCSNTAKSYFQFTTLFYYCSLFYLHFLTEQFTDSRLVHED